MPRPVRPDPSTLGAVGEEGSRHEGRSSARRRLTSLGRRAARTVTRRPTVPDYRSDRNAARISSENSSGSSQAAKCPPLSTSLK